MVAATTTTTTTSGEKPSSAPAVHKALVSYVEFEGVVREVIVATAARALVAIICIIVFIVVRASIRPITS